MSDAITDMFPEARTDPAEDPDRRYTTPSTMVLAQRLALVEEWDVDVAADEESHWADRWYGITQNGLLQPWCGRVWCNPPFSDVEPWLERAWQAMTLPKSELNAAEVGRDAAARQPHGAAVVAQVGRAAARQRRPLVSMAKLRRPAPSVRLAHQPLLALAYSLRPPRQPGRRRLWLATFRQRAADLESRVINPMLKTLVVVETAYRTRPRTPPELHRWVGDPEARDRAIYYAKIRAMLTKLVTVGCKHTRTTNDVGEIHTCVDCGAVSSRPRQEPDFTPATEAPACSSES